MEKQATVKAADLPSAARVWLGGVLHLDLTDGDECTVIVRRPPLESELRQHEVAREQIFELMDDMGKRSAAVPDAEMEEVIEDAFQSVRKQHRNASHS